MYWPTWVDILTLIGSFGLFFTLFLLFIRFLPMVAMAEVKATMPQAHAHLHGHNGADGHDGKAPARKLAEATR
jgi:molybdopterin-containing oxidoreductase family membrane subunit